MTVCIPFRILQGVPKTALPKTEITRFSSLIHLLLPYHHVHEYYDHRPIDILLKKKGKAFQKPCQIDSNGL